MVAGCYFIFIPLHSVFKRTYYLDQFCTIKYLYKIACSVWQILNSFSKLSLLNSEKKCCGDDRIIWRHHVYGPSHYLWNGIVNWGSFCTVMYLLHKCQNISHFLLFIFSIHWVSFFDHLWNFCKENKWMFDFFPQKIQRHKFIYTETKNIQDIFQLTKEAGTVFTKLHFLCNLWIGSIG